MNAKQLDDEPSYRDLYENMPVMYFEMNDEGIVLSVNAFGAEQLGYTPTDLIGRPVLHVIHEDDRDLVLEQFQSLVHTGGGIASWEFRKRCRDGTVMWVRESARAVRTGRGHIVVMVVCQDITLRVRAEEESRQAERLVRQLSLQLDEAQERERRRIAVHLHDDVGQTLALAQIKLAQVSRPDTDVRDDLESIRELIQQAIEETRSLTFDLASPVLYELGLAEALRSLCERQQSDSGTRFHFECDDAATDPPDRVAVPLYRIACELVFNVRKHADAQHVWITLEQRDAKVFLAVRDDGVGFDPSSVRTPPSGTLGIGLFTIGQHLDLLGGSIEIHSELGSGSAITVCCGLVFDEEASPDS